MKEKKFLGGTFVVLLSLLLEKQPISMNVRVTRQVKKA